MLVPMWVSKQGNPQQDVKFIDDIKEAYTSTRKNIQDPTKI